MSPNRPARLNRTVLALLGLLLLLAGALVIIVGSGAAAAAHAALPIAADAPLLPQNPDPPAWLPWAGTAAASAGGGSVRGLLGASRDPAGAHEPGGSARGSEDRDRRVRDGAARSDGSLDPRARG